MGAKDSKLSFISYDDAVKRVSDSELRRIREAFKRCAGANGSVLSFEVFVQEVLCDGVPFEVAEWLYQACGGTKRGITFKDLLRGVVVLTKGNIEEKIKFLWTLYVNNQSDNGTHIYKRDFAKALHLENTSLPVSESHQTLEILTSLFGSCERVTFDQFRSWLLMHKDATVLSKWLLFDRSSVPQDLETPTFYQSLAGVTHLEERDIIDLEKCFWGLRNSMPTGELDLQSMSGLLSPPLPRAAVEGTFLAFDENRDGHIDFKELCCGLSAACRGPTTERLKFCFKIFDLDRDGVLNKKELVDMIEILCTIANEAIKNQGSRSSTPSDGESEGEKGFDPETVLNNLKEKLVAVPSDGRKPTFQLGPTNGEQIFTSSEDGSVGLRLEEFLIWSVESAEALVAPCRELLLELCHVVLGLRPECRHRERDIVLGWLRRETGRGLAAGQFWYLVASGWWRAWLQHCGAPGPCCRRDDPAPDDSFTTNSTESMGSLLWPAESASLGSAGGSAAGSAASDSSGVGSVRAAPHPGPVDNAALLGGGGGPGVRALTGEGGTLRRDVTLAQHRDFELVPDALWRALALWYGAPDPLPRQVIRPRAADAELELYPLQMRIYRHAPGPQRSTALGALGAGAAAGAAGASAGALYAAPPERQLAYTAAFSRLATVKQVTEFLCGALGLAREAVRLWALGAGALLLDDERPTLQALRLDERTKLLLEVRNADLTWPEEIGALGGAHSACGGGAARWAERRETLTVSQLPGATGLHNLGNTCFMNAALQSVWNTGPLAQYFNSGLHLYEVNAANPLGTGGALALRFGELCREVWTSSARSVAPVRVRWCVSRYARALAGGGQHDAQELLAWLLDALHEDLNRASPPALEAARASAPDAATEDESTPKAEAEPDSAPESSAAPAAPRRRSDREAAAEAWEAHCRRNDSIMSELFYGQLKSKVRCSVCAGESVRFETFNMLSLPLPMESFVCAIVRVILLDGTVPVKYGVRVNSEGTYMDLKKNLSELCSLSPDSMLLVVLSGATIGRVLEASNKVSASSARDLVAYELPAADGDDVSDADEWSSDIEESDSGVTEGALSDEDERGRAPADERDEADERAESDERDERDERDGRPAGSRSRSELLMSASPPALCELRRLPRAASQPAAAPASASPSAPPPAPDTYLVAVHRKQVSGEGYLAGGAPRAALFGAPLVVPAGAGAAGRALYARVWTQLARLLSARPAARPRATHNHATDCDDSLGYEFPFTLRVVGASGMWCALCAWPALCRGCVLPASDQPLFRDGSCRPRKRSDVRPDAPDTSSPIAKAKLRRQTSSRFSNRYSSHLSSEGVVRRLDLGALRRSGVHVMLAIDWDPTALHLRYQCTREKAVVEHGSVSRCLAAGAQPVDLASCLRAFTGEERLETRYPCGPCARPQPATKKLQIWRLPPVLIVHLKRFQYVNDKWIKSHKVVDFPFEDFDPTPYLASVPQETILRHVELKNSRRRSPNFLDIDDHISESDSENSENEASGTGDGDACEDTSRRKSNERKRRGSTETKGRKRLESTSLITTPVLDDDLVDYHGHRLQPERDPFDLKYRLYAVVSHSGQLSGGHYVSYARHASGAWLCYNDSSCRELGAAPQLDAAAAYLLFYERRGLRYDDYLPAPRAPLRPPDARPAPRPACSLM